MQGLYGGRKILKGMIASITLLCVLLGLPLSSFAQDAPDMSISILSEQESNTRYFTARIEVHLHNLAYYHGDLYLTYHAFADAELTEPIPVTNAALLHLILDEEGRTHVELKVDVRELQQPEIYIQYDVLDDKYGFWFSSSPIASFEGEVGIIHYQPVSEFLYPLTTAVRGRPIIFAVNFVVCLLAIITIAYIRKKRLLSFR